MRSAGPSRSEFEPRPVVVRLRLDQGSALRKLVGDRRGVLSARIREFVDRCLDEDLGEDWREGASRATYRRSGPAPTTERSDEEEGVEEELPAEPEREEVTREAGETESDSVPQQPEWVGQLPEGPFCETVMNLLEQGPSAESEIHAHVGVSKGDNLLFDLLYEDLDSLVRVGLIRFDPEYQQYGEKTEGIYYLPRDGE